MVSVVIAYVVFIISQRNGLSDDDIVTRHTKPRRDDAVFVQFIVQSLSHILTRLRIRFLELFFLVTDALVLGVLV